MNEMAWPYGPQDYIGYPNWTSYCHSRGDGLTTLRTLLGAGGSGDTFDLDDRAAVVAWHRAHGNGDLPIVRAQDWQRMVEEYVPEPAPEPKKAPRKRATRKSK